MSRGRHRLLRRPLQAGRLRFASWTAAQIACRDGAFAKLAQMPEWRDEPARLAQDPGYFNRREAKSCLDSQFQELRAVLAGPGLAN